MIKQPQTVEAGNGRLDWGRHQKKKKRPLLIRAGVGLPGSSESGTVRDGLWTVLS